MDKAAGGMDRGMEIKHGHEAGGITVEAIELGELIEHADKIRRLNYNVLDTSKNQRQEGSIAQRREVIKEVRGEMKHSADHDLVLVAKNSADEIVGFLSIEKDGSSARAREMWVGVANGSQKSIIAHLIDSALHHLQSGPKQYAKLHIHPVSASSDFGVVCAEPERGRQLVIEHSEGSSESMENAA